MISTSAITLQQHVHAFWYCLADITLDISLSPVEFTDVYKYNVHLDKKTFVVHITHLPVFDLFVKCCWTSEYMISTIDTY